MSSARFRIRFCDAEYAEIVLRLSKQFVAMRGFSVRLLPCIQPLANLRPILLPSEPLLRKASGSNVHKAPASVAGHIF